MDNSIQEKHSSIREDIRKKIESKEYTDKIPSLQMLAKIYNVSITTANKAVTALVNENLLCREKGKGTFINDSGKSRQRFAAILMHASGHIFEAMAKSIQRELQRCDYFPFLIDLTLFDPEAIRGKLQDIISLNPELIVFQAIYDPAGRACADFLDSNIKRSSRLIVINNSEGARTLKGDHILYDHWQGAYKMTKHLLDLGHEKVAYLTHKINVPTECLRFCEAFQKELGYKMAMEEYGLEPELFYLRNQKDVDALKKRLKDKRKRPSAIFAYQDSRAATLLKIVQKLGLAVPDDISIAGYYNTPWCENCNPSLTSVSINEEEVGKLVVEILNGSQGERFMLEKPELIIRESTRAVTGKKKSSK